MKASIPTPVYILLAVSSALMGLSMLLMGDHRHITLVIDFYHLEALASGAVFNVTAAVSFLLVTIFSLFSIKKIECRKPLGVWLTIIGAVPLIALFSSKMWIGSLGGFPAIGAGQGVIKYFALLSVGLLILLPHLEKTTQKAIAAFPVILVLLWIGGMKFTELEAKGIESLVNTSPLMSWMYKIWDVQMTSNLIGVYDLIAMALVIAAIFKRQFLLPAVLMSGAVFVVTQTFLFTADGVFSADSIVTTTGHFLIKDLWFIANLVCLWKLSEAE
ncbi:DUF417 family protein [Parashewanella tropica]|uniref:DUF417 family protein n=1 Tax=Parashewanella tropica TaxID=2547970 RepID=UPI001FECFD10|nr:DUF417 family protein [Parashewanella tropica]